MNKPKHLTEFLGILIFAVFWTVLTAATIDDMPHDSFIYIAVMVSAVSFFLAFVFLFRD